MTKQLTARTRKELKKKMAAVFSEKIRTLSPQFQGVLLDDLVGAFENRLLILNKANQTMQFAVAMTESAECETVET